MCHPGMDEAFSVIHATRRTHLALTCLLYTLLCFLEFLPFAFVVEAVFFEFDDDLDGRVNFAQFERMWLRGK